MITVDYSIVILTSPDQVFALLTSLENRQQWEPNLLEERLYPDAERRLGTRIYQVRRFMGGKIESQFSVVAFEPGRVYGLKSLVESVPEFSATYTLTHVEGGTRVEFALALEMRRLPLGRLLEPLAARLARGVVVDMLKRLKAALELA